jgi:hypothetical protein
LITIIVKLHFTSEFIVQQRQIHPGAKAAPLPVKSNQADIPLCLEGVALRALATDVQLSAVTSGDKAGKA